MKTKRPLTLLKPKAQSQKVQTPQARTGKTHKTVATCWRLDQKSSRPGILDCPRWPNGPEICVRTSLPYFADSAALDAFVNSTLSNPYRKWKCRACGGFHVICKAPAPAGGSSGTSREYRIPPHLQKIINETEIK